MQQCARQAGDAILGRDRILLLEPGKHLSRRLHHADAVAVTGMIGPGIRQRRHPQLPDASQALELAGIDQGEQQRVFVAIHAKRDDVVNRIADEFLAHAQAVLMFGSSGAACVDAVDG